MFAGLISRSLLSLGHAPLIVLIFSIVHWFLSKTEGRHLLYLLLLSMIFNAALKVYFKVPLKPHLANPNWYAFPSGHMQMVTVLYGAVFWVYRQRFSVLWGVPFLLGLYGWALVHQNFHDYYDVWAGFGAGILLLSLYQGVRYFLIDRMGFWWAHFVWMLPAVPLVLYVFYETAQPVMHPWQGLGGLVGLTFGCYLSKDHDDAFAFNMGRCVLGLLGFVLLWLGNGFIFKSLGFPLFPFISFSVLGFWLSGGVDACWDLMFRPFRQGH